jgi:hypothetical protein
MPTVMYHPAGSESERSPCGKTRDPKLSEGLNGLHDGSQSACRGIVSRLTFAVSLLHQLAAARASLRWVVAALVGEPLISFAPAIGVAAFLAASDLIAKGRHRPSIHQLSLSTSSEISFAACSMVRASSASSRWRFAA